MNKILLQFSLKKNIITPLLLILASCFVDLIYAESSGIDPYQTVQSFLSSPSDTTRESVIEMTKSIFTKPYSTYSPEIYAPSSNSEDLSISYLEQMFGTVPGVLSGSSTTLLSEMFYVFNLGIFAVVGLILSMIIVTNTVNTGAQGQFMGRKNQNPYWIWVRSFTGVSLLMPSYNGYSLVQVIIMWTAVQGIGLSNSIWAEVQNMVYQTNSILSYVKLVDADSNTSVAGIDPLTEAEQKAYNRCQYKQDRDCTAQGSFLSNSNVDNAMNLTQMLLMYQACLDYNLKKWEEDYEACMKVAGSFDNKSCYPPRKEDLYTINYSTYQMTYVGPSGSASTYGCGNIYMTPRCINTSDCDDYEVDYDKKMFSGFVALFQAAEKPSSMIFDYYDTCNEEDGSQSCYDPPNEEQSSNCIGPDGSVSSNCDITSESITAMTDMVNKAITYQMEFSDNQTISSLNVGETEKGYADALGFMDGGWILAGNSYGTMVYYGATSGGGTLPMMNYFRTTLSKSSLPDSLNKVYEYITPKSSSMSDFTDGNTQSLGAAVTLQQSLLDWSNIVSEDEVDKAQTEVESAQSSSDDSSKITGSPVNQCMTGDYFYQDGKAVACNEVLGGEPPNTSAAEVDDKNCGKSDFSMRYLSCIVTNNIKSKEYLKFPFNAGTDKNWSKFLKPSYDIGIDLPSTYPGQGAVSAPQWDDISTDYFNEIHKAWVVAMFGGQDVRNIVDPIYRMRMMGIKMIESTTGYVSNVVSDSLEFVQGVVFDFYFGYFWAKISAVVVLNFGVYALGSAQISINTAMNTAAAVAEGIPIVGPAIALIIEGLKILINVIFAVIYSVIHIVNVLMDVLASLFPILSQIIILSGTQYFTLYLAIAVPILILGGYIAGYLSMVPYLVFIVTVAGWFLLILESSIAAPMIAMGVTYPQGHDFFGRSEQLLSMLLNIFLRPASILIGFIFGIMMASMSLFLLNAIFFPVIINFMGFLVGSDFLSIELTNYIQGAVSTSPFNSYDGGIIDTFIYFMLMLLYAYVASSTLIYSFSLTYMIPYQLTRWVDPRAAESPEEVRGAMDEIKQSFVGEVIGGMANALTSLFALTSMFAQTAQMAPTGTSSFNPGILAEHTKNGEGNANVR